MASLKLGSKPDAFQRQGQAWYCTTGLPSDVVIEIGEISFHLHKFPLLSRSGVLEKLIEESSTADGTACIIQLHDIPGGAKAFELVAKFCYGVRLELTALNVVSVRCAAEHLRMTEEYGEGNLILQTEEFLSEVFSSWKDTIIALETCEEVLLHAEELHVVTRCINSLAMKACSDASLFGWPMGGGQRTLQSPGGSLLWNGIGTGATPKPVTSDWWYEDLAVLSFPLLKRLILAMESKGMSPDNIAGCLTFYANSHLPGLQKRNSGNQEKNSRISVPTEGEQRALLEEIVGLLPMQKGVTSTKFLLGLLRTAVILHASSSSRENLEKRVGIQLDQASLEDLLLPNLTYSVETLYDIDCVQRILDHFLVSDQASAATSPCLVDEGQLIGSPSLSPITMVSRLIDGFLAEIAPDVNLKFSKFQALAAMIPDYARTLDDGIYRAIDIYLKAHPWLTDSEREQLCRLMNCQKLSLEACTHAAQNERLPLRVVVQVLFFEQLRLRTSIAGWFFVSDNIDNGQGHHSLDLPKNEGTISAAPVHIKDSHNLKVGIDDMRVRVCELEKEYLSMKQEIEKLGKPKSSWSVFSRKLGFKFRPQFCNPRENSVAIQDPPKGGPA
ncbi:BTB/POZ domain-containing protein At1g30440-like [Nymphaea colorata]|nr:BTB/POZ domain-containing protein At1g30440-like [Nymphaea colorata]